MYEGMEGLGQAQVTPELFDYGYPWWMSADSGAGTVSPDGTIPGMWNPWLQQGGVSPAGTPLDIGYTTHVETACPQCPGGEIPWGWIALAGIGGLLLGGRRRGGGGT
jgi:hypothetical protein